MKRQHGQSMVEFALIAPMVFLMIFGMIWGGYMFMEYLRFSNDVRAAARAIAVTSDENRESAIERYKTTLLQTYTLAEVPNLYKVTEETIDIHKEDDDIVVKISFIRRNDLPMVLMWVNFPPERIPALNYRMKIENTKTTEDS